MRTPITRIEKVTGVFVIVILTLLAVILFVTAQRHNVFGLYESHLVYTYLKEGYDIKKGAPVLIANVDVGVVSDLKLVKQSPVPGKPVRASLRIEGEYTDFLYQGTVCKIDRQPIGGTRLELISPTATAERLHLLPNQATILSVVPESLVERLASLKTDVEEIKEEVVLTLRDVQKTIVNIRTITDGLVAGKGIAGRLLQDDDMAAQVSALIAQARASVDDLKEIMKNARAATESVPAATANAREVTEKLNRIMDELPKVMASVERTLADVEVVAANVRLASGRFPEVARRTDETLVEVGATIEAVQSVPPVSWGMAEPRPPASEFQALPRGGSR